MRSSAILFAAAIGALLLALAAAPCAAAKREMRHGASAREMRRSASGRETRPPSLDVKPGQELTIPISIVDGKVVAGVPRASKLGASQPNEGEITVGLERETGELYNRITVTEKTAQPIDFLVTGLNGEIKIDETEICGRLDAPTTAHIGSTAWRFWINGFEVGKGGESCR